MTDEIPGLKGRALFNYTQLLLREGLSLKENLRRQERRRYDLLIKELNHERKTKEAEKAAETQELSDLYEKGDRALDFISEYAPQVIISEVSEDFIEHGDFQHADDLGLSMNAIEAVIEAKTEFVNQAIEDVGMDSDLLALILEGHEFGDDLGKQARRAALTGDVASLRVIAGRCVQDADKSDSFGEYLQEQGHQVLKGTDGI